MKKDHVSSHKRQSSFLQEVMFFATCLAGFAAIMYVPRLFWSGWGQPWPGPNRVYVWRVTVNAVKELAPRTSTPTYEPDGISQSSPTISTDDGPEPWSKGEVSKGGSTALRSAATKMP